MSEPERQIEQDNYQDTPTAPNDDDDDADSQTVPDTSIDRVLDLLVEDLEVELCGAFRKSTGIIAQDLYVFFPGLFRDMLLNQFNYCRYTDAEDDYLSNAVNLTKKLQANPSESALDFLTRMNSLLPENVRIELDNSSSYLDAMSGNDFFLVMRSIFNKRDFEKIKGESQKIIDRLEGVDIVGSIRKRIAANLDTIEKKLKAGGRAAESAESIRRENAALEEIIESYIKMTSEEQSQMVKVLKEKYRIVTSEGELSKIYRKLQQKADVLTQREYDSAYEQLILAKVAADDLLFGQMNLLHQTIKERMKQICADAGYKKEKLIVRSNIGWNLEAAVNKIIQDIVMRVSSKPKYNDLKCSYVPNVKSSLKGPDRGAKAEFDGLIVCTVSGTSETYILKIIETKSNMNEMYEPGKDNDISKLFQGIKLLADSLPVELKIGDKKSSIVAYDTKKNAAVANLITANSFRYIQLVDPIDNGEYLKNPTNCKQMEEDADSLRETYQSEDVVAESKYYTGIIYICCTRKTEEKIDCFTKRKGRAESFYLPMVSGSILTNITEMLRQKKSPIVESLEMQEVRNLFEELEQYHPKIINHIISLNTTIKTNSESEVVPWYGLTEYVESKLDDTEKDLLEQMIEKINLIHEKIFIGDVINAYMKPHFITRNFIHYPLSRRSDEIDQSSTSKNSHSYILFHNCESLREQDR